MQIKRWLKGKGMVVIIIWRRWLGEEHAGCRRDKRWVTEEQDNAVRVRGLTRQTKVTMRWGGSGEGEWKKEKMLWWQSEGANVEVRSKSRLGKVVEMQIVAFCCFGRKSPRILGGGEAEYLIWQSCSLISPLAGISGRGDATCPDWQAGGGEGWSY